MRRNKLKKLMSGTLTVVCAIIFIVIGSATLANADRLAQVKKAGILHCGVVPGAPGYAFPNKEGKMIGFDVDLCSAIAAAVLGDASKYKTTKMTLPVAFTAMKAGTVDVVTHRFTWTFSRDVGQALDFTRVMVYDGQGFMVRKSLGIKSVKELDGATLCLSVGSTTQANATDYFRTHGMTFKQVSFASMGDAQRAYNSGRCDAYSTDKYGLGGRRMAMTNPDEHMILPETISNEPIAPMVGHGDQNWRDIVVWVLNALISAEEYGITSKNIDDMRKNSKDPFVQRILGVSASYGSKMGLSDDWSYNAIKAVGNYSEIWDRHLGKYGLKLDRGKNELHTNGGLLISPPFR
jgi:general L-amino acid transport system substrate-binding protein